MFRASSARVGASLDAGDFIIQVNWCMSGATWGHGDVNYDTTVSTGDILIVAAHYGQSI